MNDYETGLDVKENGTWVKQRKDGIILSKDTFAITNVDVFGNLIGGQLEISVELDNIGVDIFDGSESDILEIARSIPRPQEKDMQYGTFVTLWKIVFEKYNSYESMYPEYDVWVEMVGAVDLSKLADSNCFLEVEK